MQDPTCLGPQQRKDFAAAYKKQNPRENFDGSRGPPRQVAMSGSLFCACPEGDSPSAKRQYDAILTGCIPVIVSDDLMYAYSTENGGNLNPHDFSVQLSEASVVDKNPGLLPQLSALSPSQVLALRAGVQRAAHWLQNDVGDLQDAPGCDRVNADDAEYVPASQFPQRSADS